MVDLTAPKLYGGHYNVDCNVVELSTIHGFHGHCCHCLFTHVGVFFIDAGIGHTFTRQVGKEEVGKGPKVDRVHVDGPTAVSLPGSAVLNKFSWF